ncbi:hypothetical protein B0H21DRAFT_825719 [Amylocystis lapponica]|nr:hypothetical protein B0H21DRAFT_825719 [Amylocystis lapponica]
MRLGEMLLEANAGDDADRRALEGAPLPLAHHLSQHLPYGQAPRGRHRSNMKRVERCGTLESQHLASLAQQPAAIHPSSHHQSAPIANGRVPASQPSSSSDRSIHRTDSLPTHSHPQTPRGVVGPAGTYITLSNTYGRHERDKPRIRPTSPHYSQRTGPLRSSPTPPYIVTLPGSSVGDEDGALLQKGDGLGSGISLFIATNICESIV